MEMRNQEMSLYDYLMEVQLDKFEQSLNKQSVYSVRDLRKIDHSKLISGVGMTRIQANRVIRTLGELFQDLKLNQETTPALPPKSASLVEDSMTVRHKSQNSEIPIAKVRCQFLDRQGISSPIAYPTQVIHSMKYFEFVHQIYDILRKEKKELNFTSVELYAEKGYPLAPFPSIYCQPLSNWEIRDNELIYAYPKKLYNENISGSDDDHCDEFIISIGMKNSDIRKELKFFKKKISYFDLKILLSLDMHIPVDCINIHYFNLTHQCEKIAPDKMDIQREFIHKSNISFTISDTYLNNENGLQLTYSSCFPSNSLPKFSALNADIQELVREYSENRDKDKLLRRLELLEKISYSPPLVHALYLIFTQSPTSLPHRIAINEGIITTFSILKISNNPTISTFPQLWKHIEECALTPDLWDTFKTNMKFFPKEEFSISERDFCHKTHNNDRNVSHPPTLICPLTKQLFEIPVMTPDGNTYEHNAILQHIKKENTDPLSNTPILPSNLRPNRAVADAIFKYRKKMNIN